MSIAKLFLKEHKHRFYCDATAEQAWRDAVSCGCSAAGGYVEFADGSRLIRDPMAGSIVATDS